MLMVISPAKKLDMRSKSVVDGLEGPQFIRQSTQLMNYLKKLTPRQISDLMGISDKLAQLNAARFAQWHTPFTPQNAKAAIYTFSGDVYQGINATTLKKPMINYLQHHLRILSGLYGLLRPLDLIQPYRLEMGRKVSIGHTKDLYSFWRQTVTATINQLLDQQKKPVLVNLASNEYFKVLDKKHLNGSIVTPQFKDWKNGHYKMISFYAKKARGSMVRFAAENKLKQVEEMKCFDRDGYSLNQKLSSETNWIFTRKQA